MQDTLIFFACLVGAIILHELSHGVVALWLGDDTARRAGRLTLNPIPHLDLFGSIIIPALGALTGLPVIGWAKPVPVNPNRLHHPRRDIVLVSLAGPTTNFLLMAGAAFATRSLLHNEGFIGFDLGDGASTTLITAVFAFAVVNLFLGLFNLLPIPPLDGSALVERLLPSKWLPHWYRFRPYGVLILFGLVIFTGALDWFLSPFYERLRDFVVS